MSDQRLSTEHTIRVYDDDHGFFVQIGPDRDGLDLCEIAYFEDAKTERRNINLSWAHARAVAEAILKLAPEHEA